MLLAIRLLDQRTINKIAAGEVVESPKSVVKELTENAIDAGATTITTEIKDGGISYIRVSDNGCGIPKAQVQEAFLRHATSKLSKIEDLEEILTMGFRGEALASIAAVAQVEMTTKTREEATGTKIEISGGEVKSIQDIACTEGTSIVVKNLFYNVPARKKFLKKPATESGYVSDLMNKLALGHPELSFCYINNDNTILHTVGNGDGKASVFYVYGKEVANAMLDISFARGEYKLTGYVGKPELSRANRNYENLFINGRFIKNRIVASAVEEAYKTRMMVGKFPVYVLHLEVNPALVDVNVHPAKLEVRFRNDEEVYAFFYDAITAVFADAVCIPKVSWDKKPPVAEQQVLPADTPVEQKPIETVFEKQSSDTAPPIQTKSIDQLLKRKGHQTKVEQDTVAYQVEPKQDTAAEDFEVEKVQVEQPQIIETPKKKKEQFFKDYKIIGQVFRTYWVVEQGDNMYVIDQHAAHERILYERLMERFQKEDVVSQRLLEPLMLHLTPLEVTTLEENKALLQNFGFGVERFAEQTYGLHTVPVLMKTPDGAGFFRDILDTLQEQQLQNVYDAKIHAVATMACKAAVKGHDTLDIQEAEALIAQLMKLENPFHCPHGRPTVIALTKYELEKKFKRIQN